MKLKKSKRLVGIILVTVILFSFSLVSYAYIHYPYGYLDSYVEIEDRTTYHYEFEAARGAWNATATPVYITTVPGSGNNWITDDVYATTWRGLYTAEMLQYVFWGRATKFSIKLNRTYLVNDVFKVRQSTITHELGHVFCLADNPSNSTTPNNSIMNYDRDKLSIYKPQQDDINGVNYAY